ncbi:Trypanosomal VSG domain containing protein, putative [Trypanosoma equiperdum]|uniref:Trypanosomal VSG domain containing protein, putative n=1 Tax=Trypanosoma equiperdum TaxID=5694 RepID=A0A1G4IAG1_TRYEQ|nr:Trypanosomal VSG domain containing protein, putative [Trypanosoma equiperdum]
MKKADEAARKTAWQEKIQQIAATTANGGKRLYAKIRDGPAQQKAAATVSAILAAADAMKQKHDNLKETATQAHGKAIKAIKDAVYGQGLVEATDTFAYTKSTKCGGTTTTGTAGAAIVEYLICLCTKRKWQPDNGVLLKRAEPCGRQQAQRCESHCKRHDGQLPQNVGGPSPNTSINCAKNRSFLRRARQATSRAIDSHGELRNMC